MEYLCIKNKGEINEYALTLLGASTKRGDDDTIGQFGSGLKFSPAYFLRNGYEVILYSGLNRMIIETKAITFRGQQFDQIFVNGKETSLTTQAGFQWECWEALREIYSNAIDEGEADMFQTSLIEPEEGVTKFYIEFKHDLQEVFYNYDDYYAFNKKVLYETDNYKIYQKHSNHSLFYRRGIRCHDVSRQTMFDYDFKNIEVDESRKVRYSWRIQIQLFRCLVGLTDINLIKRWIGSISIDKTLYEANWDGYDVYGHHMSEEFKEYIKTLVLAPFEYKEFIDRDQLADVTFIPSEFYNWLQQYIPELKTVGKEVREKYEFSEIQWTPQQQKVVDEAMSFLEKAKFDINFKIIPTRFNLSTIAGKAHEGNILLGVKSVDKGVHDTVNTILHEYLHLYTGFGDKTRSFEDAIIDVLVNYMKKVTGITI